MNNNSKKECVLFFVKYPEKGKVKNRLSSALEHASVVELYKNFVLDILATLDKSKIPFWICYSPSRKLKKLAQWLGKHHTYKPQYGENLGERMKDCFSHSFSEGFERVVVIGSDSPDISENLIKRSLKSLRKNNAVIGPSYDGGYYLLGFRKGDFNPKIFDKVRWSSSQVFDQTVNTLRKNKSSFNILPNLRDIDTYSDLNSFYKKAAKVRGKESRTWNYLVNNKEALKLKT
ncbi:MAG: TIGR04282 family arsenosugar biosynthesis glycosyltransferase [bacterium]